MNATFRNSNRYLTWVACAWCATFVLNEPASVAAAEDDMVVVLRISRELVEQTLDRTIQRKQYVGMQILDAWCEGTARVEGQLAAEFPSDQGNEGIRLRISGSSSGRFNGYAKPIVTTSQNTTTFAAHFDLYFDGAGFSYGPPHVSADSVSTICCVDVNKGVPGRRLIRAAARCFAPKMTPRYDAEGARLARGQIRNAITAGMGEVLEDLNGFIRIDDTMLAFAMGEQYVRTPSRTKDYLQLRIAPENQLEPIPPQQELLGAAPLEVWVYPNSKRPAQADILMRWQQTQDALREMLPSVPVPRLPLDDVVRVTPMGKWDAIQIARLPEIPLPVD